jgi:hypothetical protein
MQKVAILVNRQVDNRQEVWGILSISGFTCRAIVQYLNLS